MSAGAWLRSQRDRPISDGERRIAFTIVAVAATVCALLLAIGVPGVPSPRTATRLHAHARPKAPASAVLAVAEELAAREFLTGYLAYIYGHARARDVRGATPAFTHALLARSSPVPPSMRARRPRIVALQIAKAPAGALGVSAIINDGGLVNYPVTLQLAYRGHRLLVSGLAGA